MRVLVVLGMHRSGTSCLAGALEQAGVFLGEVFTQNPFNARGNRESARIMRLHEGLLADDGCAWDAPPPVGETLRWSAARREERDELVALYADRPVWGFKDPRTLLALPGWRDALPGLETVGTFRHPLAVAGSLAHRNGFPRERALELWWNYNVRLLAEHHAAGTPLVCFDAGENEFRAALGRLGERLGLGGDLGATGFFAEELRHQRPTTDEPLPAAVADLYAELKSVALDGA